MKLLARHLSPLLVGAVAFLLMTGGTILAPTYVDWLMQGGDPAQHWLGWQFFRQSPFLQWPLGANPGFGMDIGSSIVFSDSLPLFALVFKPFSAMLPGDFQYFGLWIFGCFLLQSYFAWLLLGQFTENRWLRLLGCGFFSIAPAMLWRLHGHHALFGQWTLLAALVLYFAPSFSARRWTGLLVVTALIHAYLLAMVLAIYLAAVVQRVWLRRLSIAVAVRDVLVAALSVGVVMWAAGYFMLGPGAESVGFGYYRMNLLSPFDPEDIWSALLPNQKQGPGDYEGFNFLGSGMLGLGLVAVLATVWARAPGKVDEVLPRMAPILAVSAVLFLFAISNHVAIGGRELLSYRLPLPIEHLANNFRSSGRFFWPVYYLIYLAIFYLLFTRIPARAAVTICAVALVFQVVDSHAAGKRLRKRLAHAPEWSSPLHAAVWDDIASQYRNIIVVLPHNTSPGWVPLSRFAADHGLAINTGYFARIDAGIEQETGTRIADSIMSNRLDRDSLYVFQDDELWKIALSQLQPSDVAGTVDGFRIVAPRLSNCVDCDRNAVASIMTSDGKDYRYRGGRVLFTSSGLGSKYTGSGWSWPEEWGTWSDGDTADLRFGLSDSPEGDVQLLIEGHAFLAESHPLQEVDVSVNGRYLQTLKYDLQDNYGTRVVRIEEEIVVDSAGSLRVGFNIRDPQSPADLKLSGDGRRLGLGVVAIELRCPNRCGE